MSIDDDAVDGDRGIGDGASDEDVDEVELKEMT